MCNQITNSFEFTVTIVCIFLVKTKTNNKNYPEIYKHTLSITILKQIKY